ncbi:MAG: T9SS type A sorting domain-containing protein [Flavobacteriales bacterium]
MKVKITKTMCIAIIGVMFTEIGYTQISNNWYFGLNAGLSFSTDPPTALSDGELSTNEGCASISSASGSLLFYTDGISVYTSTHVLMTDVNLNPVNNLHGSASSTQSANIIPKPQSSSEYYIFTTDALGANYGLQYSTIDMSLGGGLGQVVESNVELFSPSCEKICATYHDNGMDIWVVAHEWNTNEFKAYRVTSTGVISTPVESVVGVSHTGGTQTGFNSVGAMKISPSRDRIACCLRDARVELFDFDAETGMVTNYMNLTPSASGNPTFYGLEFSPSGQYLYYSQILGASLHRFDISFEYVDEIISSNELVGNGSDQMGQLQLGPDNRLYAALTVNQTTGVAALAVVGNPDASNPTFIEFGQALATNKYSLLGLPNFISGTQPKPDQVSEPQANLPSLQVNIYPNHANNQISIARVDATGILCLNIYDSEGKLVDTDTIGSGVSIHNYNCHKLSSGFYVFAFNSKYGVVNVKVVIE